MQGVGGEGIGVEVSVFGRWLVIQSVSSQCCITFCFDCPSTVLLSFSRVLFRVVRVVSTVHMHECIFSMAGLVMSLMRLVVGMSVGELVAGFGSICSSSRKVSDCRPSVMGLFG